MKTLDDVMSKMLESFPDGQLGDDLQSQVIIYTGLYQLKDGTVGTFDEAYPDNPQGSE